MLKKPIRADIFRRNYMVLGMTEKIEEMKTTTAGSRQSITDFTESYASFNRIINNLQRQYIDLKEEFTAQNRLLADTNQKLIEMTRQNLTATEFLKSILNSIAAGIIAVDRSGTVTSFNPAASLLFGIPQGEPVGKPYREVIPPGEPAGANALRAVESGRAQESTDKEIVLADGTRLCLSVSTAIIRNSEGEPTGAVEVLHDLTRLKKMEEELTRLNTLAALGEMAATIAHEVRNPLSAISGFASLLKRDIDQDDPKQKLVNKICLGAESLNSTVTNLLNYARVEDVKREEVEYDEFLRRTVTQYSCENPDMVAEVKINLQTAFGSGATGIKVELDPVLMRQTLFNLFNNAVEACNGSGTIDITYQQLPRQKATRLYADRIILGLDETVVETTVTDSGSGIPVESLEKLFTPFFSTTRSGTGLGLAVVWKIVKSHGGEIIADNAPEGGARFVVLLPTKIDHANIGTDADTSDMECCK